MTEWIKGLRFQGIEKTQRARALRRQGTDAENRLWGFLKKRGFAGIKFRRQVSFGPYYLDFYCAEKKVAIELDGGQHYSSAGKMKDHRRDVFLRAHGLKVVRYSDRDILLNEAVVLEDLWNVLTVRKSSPQPSPFQGEGEV